MTDQTDIEWLRKLSQLPEPKGYYADRLAQQLLERDEIARRLLGPLLDVLESAAIDAYSPDDPVYLALNAIAAERGRVEGK